MNLLYVSESLKPYTLALVISNAIAVDLFLLRLLRVILYVEHLAKFAQIIADLLDLACLNDSD